MWYKTTPLRYIQPHDKEAPTANLLLAREMVWIWQGLGDKAMVANSQKG